MEKQKQLMRKYRRRALIAIIITVAITSLMVFNRLGQLAKFGFCGNGPQVEYSISPNEGQDYVLLNQGNTNSAILSNKIRSLEVLPWGVFVGYVGDEALKSNLSFVNDKIIETCQVDGVGPQGHVNDILYHNGILFVATDGNGVWKYQNLAWKQLTVKNSGLVDDTTYDLVVNGGDVLVTTYDGISAWGVTAQWWHDVTTHHNPDLPNRIHAFLVEGQFQWLGTISDGLILVANGKDKTFRVDGVVGWPGDLERVDALGSNNIRVLRKGPDGFLWVGSDPGLAVFEEDVADWHNIAPGIKDGKFDVLDLEFDQQGRTWTTGAIGTYSFTPFENRKLLLLCPKNFMISANSSSIAKPTSSITVRS